MNWDDLRLFLAVARTGSISGAAKMLGVQHSTVSRRMRKLEENLGARLIERKNTGHELTLAGEDVMRAAQRIETEMLYVDSAVLNKDSSLSGSLKITAINNMASTVLMPIFADFSKANPQIDLHIMVSNIDSSLSQREADIAIRLTNSPTDTLIGKRLVTVASTIYGSRDYLNQLSAKNAGPEWIGVDCCPFHKSWTKHTCGEQPHHFFSDDTLLTLSAIKQGLGVSYLPCFMGDADTELARFRAPDPAHNLGLWLLLHPDLKQTARVIAFRTHMLESIKQISGLFEGNLS